MKFNKKVAIFLGNVLMEFRVVFLPDCSLILSLLKDRVVREFFIQKKKKGFQTGKTS